MNIFERASRKKLRFVSSHGNLSVDDLWDIPLVASTRATRDVKLDLDTLARGVSAELRSMTEDSFVEMKPDPRKAHFELQLEILKHVIASKIADANAAQARFAKAEERQKLIAALSAKEGEEIGAMSMEEIKSKLKALDE